MRSHVNLAPYRTGLLLILTLLALSLVATDRFAARVTGSSSPRDTTASHAMGRISVQASGRGNPWIRLADGRELPAIYSSSSSAAQALEQNQAQALALAAADFDEDGVADIVAGYSSPAGGIVSLQRGNIDSIYPNAPDSARRRAEGNFTNSPFLPEVRAYDLAEAADFIGAGDFDADGHKDVVTAARGGNALWLMAGDGTGGLGEARRIELSGGLTALAVGEVNRADGLADIVVGITAPGGAKALVFMGPEGALKAQPEIFALPGEAASIAIGQIGGDYNMDFAVAAGRELMVVYGRDRQTSLDEARRAEEAQAAISSREFGFAIKSIALGDFTGEQRKEIALLADGGELYALGEAKARGKKKAIDKIERWEIATVARGLSADASQLVRARLSSAPVDNLVVISQPDRRLSIVVASSDARYQALRSQPVAIDVESEPAAVLPMQLNGDALSDLVIARKGTSRLSAAVTPQSTQATFVVTSAGDLPDINPGNGVCETGNDNCTLRAAIQEANAFAGVDTITFNILPAGPKTISPQLPLPTITEAVTIDGTTQPGFVNTPIIELNGSAANSSGLVITSGNSRVRGLVINRFTNNGIEAQNFGANIIDLNYIGTDINGAADLGNGGSGVLILDSPGNTIDNNVLSGNNVSGADIDGGSALITNNFIGTNAAGTAGIGNGLEGVLVIGSPATIIGIDNLISANGTYGVRLQSDGVLVQANLLGASISGSPLPNQLNGVFVNGSGNNIANNDIAFNGAAGVGVFSGTSNVIQDNSIFSNNGLGIDLGLDGVTPNDNCDTDAGPNNLQNFPVLTSATTTAIQASLNSTANTTFTIQFFSNTACDPTGNGEGRIFIGETQVTTNASCTAAINFPASLTNGQIITATATNPGGSTSEFSNCITVTNATGCDITCPPNLTVDTPPGASLCGAIVNYPAPTITGSCSDFTCTPASGTFFPVGVTTVTCILDNDPGPGIIEADNCSFTVTVNDKTPPRITCPGNITKSTDAGQQSAVVDYPIATATDNCPGVNFVCLPPSGTRFPLGVTTVNCTARDAAANQSSCSFTITVQDQQAPTIVCPPDPPPVQLPANQTTARVTYNAPEVRDNLPGEPIIACVPASGSQFPAGMTTVTCTATDAAGNRASCSFKVTVESGNSCLVIDKTSIEFNQRIGVPPQTPPSELVTVTNRCSIAVSLQLDSILRDDSRISAAGRDDRRNFSVRVVAGNQETALNPGSSISIAPGQSVVLRIIFNPQTPEPATSFDSFTARQSLPDEINTTINLTGSNGSAFTVALRARVSQEVALINGVSFTLSGNVFTLIYSVYDPNLNIGNVKYELLDSGGQPVKTFDVDLGSAVRQANVPRGLQFTVEQRFKVKKKNSRIQSVRITVTDGEGRAVAEAPLSTSTSNAQRLLRSRAVTLIMPLLGSERYRP